VSGRSRKRSDLPPRGMPAPSQRTPILAYDRLHDVPHVLRSLQLVAFVAQPLAIVVIIGTTRIHGHDVVELRPGTDTALLLAPHAEGIALTMRSTNALQRTATDAQVGAHAMGTPECKTPTWWAGVAVVAE